jgi:hypothetical protein
LLTLANVLPGQGWPFVKHTAQKPDATGLLSSILLISFLDTLTSLNDIPQGISKL